MIHTAPSEITIEIHDPRALSPHRTPSTTYPVSGIAFRYRNVCPPSAPPPPPSYKITARRLRASISPPACHHAPSSRSPPHRKPLRAHACAALAIHACMHSCMHACIYCPWMHACAASLAMEPILPAEREARVEDRRLAHDRVPKVLEERARAAVCGRPRAAPEEHQTLLLLLLLKLP